MTEVYKLDETMEKWKNEFEKPDKPIHIDRDGSLDRLGMYQAGIKEGLKQAYSDMNESAEWED